MVMLERRQAVNRAIERFLGGRQHSWRDNDIDPQSSAREDLFRQRPWLVLYDDGVPHTIAVPQVPLHQLLRSAERRFARRKAIHFEGYRLTYRQLGRRANRFANALLSLGLGKGDRVLLLLPNLPQLIIAYLGTLIAGGVAVFTMPVTEPDELVRQVRHSGARIMVTMPGLPNLAPLLQEQSELQHIVVTDIGECLPLGKRLAWRLTRREQRSQLAVSSSNGEGLHPFRDLLRSHSSEPPPLEVSPLDPAVIHYTGGTTAEAKGVLLSHRNLVANTIQTRHWMPEAREGSERCLCVLPYSHSYGLTTGLNVPIALGATLIVKARFEVKDTLETIKRLHPTIFPGVPQMYLTISHFPGVRRYGISSVKACISGSAPLPVEVQEEFEKLTRGRLVEGYGLTEASPVTHANPLHGRRKIGSIGIPLPSTEAKITDLADSSQQMPPGQIGELMVRGPQVMVGYWGDPEATAQTLTDDGWLHTGDVTQMDADGFFRLIARKADMWYSGRPGKWAFPRDVEEVLYEVPQVKEVAVVAIAGRPFAFVIPRKERPSADALIAYCKRRLPPELAPRLIIFVDDFPRTFIGKVLRRELAKRYAKHAS
jgi:long-chain acyl-CoA synthetase